MTANLKSLQKVTTGYTSFEKDQVLTHDQLNTLSDYADDQIRLGRVKLIGVGIASGFRLSRAAGGFELSPGIGVTTDGDLVRVDRLLQYDRFQPYDRGGPAYAPFERTVGTETERIEAYELVAVGVEAPRAVSLEAFPRGEAGLQGMTALLYVESSLFDGDLCSGTTCDNMGKQVVHEQKLLLVDREWAANLEARIRVPHAAYLELPELSVRRVVPQPTWTLANLQAAYRDAANTAHEAVMAALVKLEQVGWPLPDTFVQDPIGRWRKTLTELNRLHGASPLGIQYYYDLLRDLAETWNAAREAIFGDTEWLHDDIEQFAKHLLLGDVADATRHRCAHYPSPALRRMEASRSHHRALMRKFDRLIAGFDARSAIDKEIRVTPSALSDRSLEERAIPAYYVTDAELARSWSYRHAQRESHDRVLGYHASRYSLLPQVVEPLSGQLDGHPFFRVEGHVGKQVQAAVGELEAIVRTWSLPFKVEALMLAPEGRPVIVKPPTRHTDLHDLHAVIRQDLAQQLDEVVTFTGNFKLDLHSAVSSGIVDDAGSASGVPLTQLAQDEDAKLVAIGQSLKAKMATDYTTYRSAGNWQGDVRDALQSAARLKQDHGAVTKAHFSTPLDTLISSTHHGWLEVIDDILDAKDRAAADKLRFGEFLVRNPGADHQAGVLRGGSFLLIYDGDGIVVGDLMLPYACCASDRVIDPPRPLPKPPTIRPDWIKKFGLRLTSPLDKEIGTRLAQFEAKLKPDLIGRIEIQERYFKMFQDSRGTTTVTGVGASPTKDFLTLLEEDARLKRLMLDSIRGSENPPAERVAAAETALATSLEAIVGHMATTKASVTLGSEGYRRLEEVGAGLAVLSPQIRSKTVQSITSVRTDDPQLRRVLKTLGE